MVSVEGNIKTSRVYVGIVAYNSTNILDRCLAAIKKQTHKNIQTIVLDNSGLEAQGKTKQKFPDVLFLKNAVNSGYGGGHNEIIRRTGIGKDDYYLALNPDAILFPNYIKNLVACLKKHNAGWGSGKLYKNTRTKELYSVGHAMLRDGYPFLIGYGIKDEGQYDESREVFGAPGAAALYKASLIKQVSRQGHFFDPTLFMYYEDVDVDWRGQLAGKHCRYEPKAIAVHAGGNMSPLLLGGALGNRMLSVMKNAFPYDLFLYNLPRIVAHVIIRLLLTPPVGVKMVGRLVEGLRPSFFRTTPLVKRGHMVKWFSWAKEEKTTQPKSLPDRFVWFISKRAISKHVY